MIKVKDKTSSVDGDILELLSDYTILTKHLISLFRREGVPDETIEKWFEDANRIARMTDEELRQEDDVQ